ncbi:unnamed protein product [Medioppia subpectinata]|uniref:Fibronectin type-III domain-containing protein n=1 Tax=Medioppia subpectinata TaxID=1979941 RepID=A0A7R9KTL2_9ACAR|nr:unnamed protein product [Medioppia subpectinata]CAG2109639.1 unnamed protein product [Medioppia subpectinata]
MKLLVIFSVCLSAVMCVLGADTPTPPEIISIECKKRSAILRWSAMGEADVKEFKIQYMTNWSPNEWFDYVYKTPVVDAELRLILNPWATYKFRVISVNYVGASNASAPSDSCTTEEDIPHKNPDDVYGRGNGPKNLVISWKPMPPTEHNAPGFYYRVFYRLSDEVNSEWHERHVLDWQQHRLLIENLPKLRPYRIKVEAHNSLGRARVDAHEVIGFSDEDRPSDAPKDLRLIEVIDGKSAKLSWSAVPPMSLNGHFKGYKVQVWTESYENKSEQIVAANITTALIEIFTPESQNNVQVLAFNGAFDGPASNQITVDTPVDIYPDPPAFVWTRHTNRNNRGVIRITYEPNVTHNNPGDKIYIEYRLKGIDDLDKWQNTFKEDMEEAKGPIELGDLQFDRFYEIRVVAESGNLRAFSNISTIDTGVQKWPKPTTTTTEAPPPPPTYEQYIPRGPDTGHAPVKPGPNDKTDNLDREGPQSPEADSDGSGFSKTHWFIAFACVVAFICAFVGVFIFLKRRKSGAAEVNRNPRVKSDKIRTTSMTASKTPNNYTSDPNESNSFIVSVNDNQNNGHNGRVGHDETDDTDDDRQHRDVYNGTTETAH